MYSYIYIILDLTHWSNIMQEYKAEVLMLAHGEFRWSSPKTVFVLETQSPKAQINSPPFQIPAVYQH